MTDDIVSRLRKEALVCQLGKLPASARLCDEAAAEIERLRSRVEEFEKIIEKYDRDRIEYCDAWMKWIKDHDALDVMEWMMAYANAIPAPNPDGKSPVEIYASIDARSREAAIEIERLRARVAELEASR